MHFSTLEKFGFGVLCAAWLIWGTNKVGDMLVHADEPAQMGYQVAGAEGGGHGEKMAEKAEAPQNAMELLASADVKAGAKVFKKCHSCHSAEAGAKHKIGPNLWNVVGRKQASAEGFGYSGAFTSLGGTWTFEELDKFLTSPSDYAKGTKMTFRGVKKADKRAALLVYLATLGDTPVPLPK